MVIRDPGTGCGGASATRSDMPTTAPISSGSKRPQPLSRGGRLAALSPNTPGPVIAETGIRYHRPLAYGDEILVSARTMRLGRTSFEMEYAVWRGGLCALGRAVLILVVNATGEKTALPPELRERILARDPGVHPGAPS